MVGLPRESRISYACSLDMQKLIRSTQRRLSAARPFLAMVGRDRPGLARLCEFEIRPRPGNPRIAIDHVLVDLDAQTGLLRHNQIAMLTAEEIGADLFYFAGFTR